MILLEKDGDWEVHSWGPEVDRVRATVFNMATKDAWSFWYTFADARLPPTVDVLKRFPTRHEWVTEVMRKHYL